MDAFQRGFRRDIPLEKAAAFFVGLKSWQAPSASELALMKQAAEKVAVFGKNAPMLPSAAEMQAPSSVSAPAKAQVQKALPKPAPRTIPRTGFVPEPAFAAPAAAAKSVLAPAPGAGSGLMNKATGLAQKAWAHPAGKAGIIGAGALGAGALAVGAHKAMSHQAAPTPQVKSASAQLRLLLSFYKKAAEDTSTDGGGSELSAPTPAAVPQEAEYLANEAAGQQAEEANAVEYYKSLLEQLRGESAAAQEQAQQATEQAQQLQAQQAEHDSQIQSSMQEATMAQQAALQQVQTANAAATQAMQQAVDAENRALQSKTQETTAKIQQQQVRTQLLDMAAQGLPGSEPELGAEGNAAEGMEGTPPPAQAGGAPGEEQGQEATAAAGPSAGGMNEQGQPANAEGMPGQESAGGGAGGGAAAPGTIPQPAGDSSGGSGAGPGTGPQSNTDGQAQTPEADPTAKRQGGVSIKVGHFANPRLVALLDRLEGEQRLPLAVGS